MSLFSNNTPVLIGVYDDELSVTHFTPNNKGKILGRDSLENVHHAGGDPENHPTLPNVMRNTSGHVFLHGSFTFEWEWPEGLIAEKEIDDYIDLVTNIPLPMEYPFTIIKDTNKLIMQLPDANFRIPEWMRQPTPWHPKAPIAKIVSESDESEFVCVTRLNGSYNLYTFEQRTIESNESLVLSRPDCEVCYLMFSDHVAKGSQILLSKKLYKMTSETLEVLNNQINRVRILRYYK